MTKHPVYTQLLHFFSLMICLFSMVSKCGYHQLSVDRERIPARVRKGDQALLLAMQRGKGFTKALMKCSGNLHLRTEVGDTLLSVAAQHGHAKYVHRLLRVDSTIVNNKNKRGDTALMLASKRGHVCSMTQLLEGRADTAIINSRGNSALALAIKGKHTKAVKLLLDYKATFDKADLRLVITMGDCDVFEIFLKKQRGWFGRKRAGAMDNELVLGMVYKAIVETRKRISKLGEDLNLNEYQMCKKERLNRKCNRYIQMQEALVCLGAGRKRYFYLPYKRRQGSHLEVLMEGVPTLKLSGLTAGQYADTVASAADSKEIEGCFSNGPVRSPNN